MFKQLITSIVCATFLVSTLQYANAQPFSINQLPAPGTMVGISEAFVPLALKGLIVNPQRPLEFQFIIDTGKGPQDAAAIKDEAGQLIKYFLAGLTIPEGDLWVNLSPYEKSRMIPQALGQTELGRDLLAQDYLLKQLTASLIYPENDLGKEFWSRVYARARARFGTTDFPVNTFNKVWIMPDQAQVFENGSAAYVTKSTLRVLLDEDYLAERKHQAAKASGISSQVVRQIVIPEIEKEVNAGKNFAPLRQIYQGLILAKWYKETIQNALLDTLYTNKKKVAGVNVDDPAVKEAIYERYLKAYKTGAFNLIKEDTSPDGQVIPRKYFSGGITKLEPDHIDRSGDAAMISSNVRGALLALTVSLAAVTPALQVQSNEQAPAILAQTQSNGTAPSLSKQRVDQLIEVLQVSDNLNYNGRLEAIVELGNSGDPRAIDPIIKQSYDWTDYTYGSFGKFLPNENAVELYKETLSALIKLKVPHQGIIKWRADMIYNLHYYGQSELAVKLADSLNSGSDFTESDRESLIQTARQEMNKADRDREYEYSHKGVDDAYQEAGERIAQRQLMLKALGVNPWSRQTNSIKKLIELLGGAAFMLGLLGVLQKIRRDTDAQFKIAAFVARARLKRILDNNSGEELEAEVRRFLSGIKTPAIKVEMADLLRHSGKKEAIGPLSDMINDDYQSVRRRARESLDAILMEADLRYQMGLFGLKVGYPDTKIWAMGIVSKSGREGVVELIAEGLADGHADVRQAARAALGTLPMTSDARYQIGIAGFQGNHLDNLEWAITMLENSGKKEVISQLLREELARLIAKGKELPPVKTVGKPITWSHPEQDLSYVGSGGGADPKEYVSDEGEHSYGFPGASYREQTVPNPEYEEVQDRIRTLSSKLKALGSDAAMQAQGAKDLGGIDLKQINVLREGKKVLTHFDPAQLRQLLQGGVEGFTPVLIKLERITSPFPLLGIREPAEPVRLAKA